MAFKPSSLVGPSWGLWAIFALPHPVPHNQRGWVSQNWSIYKSTSTMAARKRLHCHTWTHINPVVRRVPRWVSINDYNNQDRTGFNIHATYFIKFTDTFHHQSTNKSYYKPCSNKIVAEAIMFENQHLTSLFQYSASPWSQPQKHDRGN